jgi:ATP-binding cassette subfamily B protein
MTAPAKAFQDDEAFTKQFDSRLAARILGYLRPYWRHVALAVFVLALTTLNAATLPFLVREAADRYIVPVDGVGLTLEERFSGLAWIALFYALRSALDLVLRFTQQYLIAWIGQRIMYDLRAQIFGHLQGLSLSFYNRNPVGRLMTRITSDVDAIEQMLSQGVVGIIADIATLVGIVIAMFVLEWRLALAILLTLPLIMWIALFFRTRIRDAFRDARRRIAIVNAYLNESITGMPVTQLFNREARNGRRFDQLSADYRNAQLRQIFWFSLFFPAILLIGEGTLVLIIGVGGWGVATGTITIGVVLAFIAWSRDFFRPLADLSEKFNIMQAAMASGERIFGLLDTQPEVVDPPDPVRLEHFRGEVQFRGVWFAYNESRDGGDPEWVLRDLSFHIRPGESVALVGATGAGKTSITALLNRFYDLQQGQILVDGVDVRRLAQRDLRKHIGMVLQDVFLFAGTIESNLRLGNEALPMESIVQAAKHVNAHRFVMKLPRGYQTEVKERGATLSTGQKQLLAFARALAANPEILLVMDEATSSVDTETELLIQDALRKLMRNRTSIIIAHRLSTIKNVDRILVMHKSRLVEEGTHEELLERGGYYHRLYRLQYADQEPPAGAAAPRPAVV